MTMLEQLNGLLEAIERYWKLTNYEIKKPVYIFSNEANNVITEWSSDTVLLPLTKLPIRGLEGVKIKKNSKDKNQLLLLIETAIEPFATWEIQYKETEVVEAKQIISELLNNVLDEFDRIPNLNERIFDASGYKHYDATELSTVISDSDNSFIKIIKKFALVRILVTKLKESNYTIKDELSFESRCHVSNKVIECLTQIANREHYKYNVLIFLNAPLVDNNNSISLGKIKIGSIEKELNISYANDEILSKVSSLNVDCINTVCSFNIAVKVDANINIYLYIYELAGIVAEKLVDSLRLICNCDIGVLGLEIVTDESFTPAIRKTFETRYQQELAPIIPKRFYYQVDSLVPITETEINEVRHLLAFDWYTNTSKGVDIAIKRFRSSIERYMPDDAEKLLDLAIAFESIYLNDGETKELTYRLSLRVARLLGNSVDERYEIFNVIKDLYKYRSKVAHGENLDSLKKADAERLNKVLENAPTILRKSIIKILSVNELKGLKDNAKIAEWWSKLELQ